jgi:hypothetical protein
MKLDPFTDALVQLVHCYHPAGLRNDEPRYKESEEGQRLTRLIHANVRPSPAWKDFLQRVREELPDCSLWDTTIPWHDPCYSVRVSQPGFKTGDPRCEEVVCLLSLLAPVYALYASYMEEKGPGILPRDGWMRFPPFPPEYQEREAKLAGLIESTFGFTRLSNETLFTPVPDLAPRTANHGPGEAQLVDCLFTTHRW